MPRFRRSRCRGFGDHDAANYAVATSDGGHDGFSRGHYLSTQPAPADLAISVVAERLDGARDKSIELAFHGGYFGVTDAAFFLYESDANWTGWQPLPPRAPGPVELRVIQRGQSVAGYVNGVLAGTFTLQLPAPAGQVGVFFKGHPGTLAQIRFRAFTIIAA